MALFDAIEYPFDAIPEPGKAVEIQPGVLWVQMPLPMALDHINLYLLEEDAGWWVVDTGIKGKTTRKLWEELFVGAMKGKPVVGVICTHMHPDHIGQAGWLSERWRMPLYMTQTEYIMGRTLTAQSAEGTTWEAVEFYQRYGMPEAFVERMRGTNPGFGVLVEPLPRSYHRVVEGDVLTIGGSEWSAVIGHGHSPEHLCLHCPERGLMLSGDQVIPRITSNVSVMGLEPQGNPLRLWMASLLRFMSLPENTLVLPSHNTPFHGLHVRLQALLEHHDDHLLAIQQACTEPTRAMDLLPVLFKRKLDDSQLGLAMGECIAHLNLLLDRGHLSCEVDEDGLFRFTTLDPERIDQRSEHTDYMDDDLIMEYEGDPI